MTGCAGCVPGSQYFQRALQTYRDNGLIPYSNIGGKFFYKEVDIQQILEEGLIKKENKEYGRHYH